MRRTEFQSLLEMRLNMHCSPIGMFWQGASALFLAQRNTIKNYLLQIFPLMNTQIIGSVFYWRL